MRILGNKKPRVSICTTTYNRANLLQKAIESVLAQDFKDFEMIICDDASTDNTEGVVKRFNDSRIRYEKNENNLGPCLNANKCLYLSEADHADGYVIFFNDDDIMMQGLLKKEVEILDKYKNVGLVVPLSYIFVDNNIIIAPKTSEDKYMIYPGMDAFLFNIIGKPILGKYILQWIFPSIMMRKKLILEIGGYDPEIKSGHDKLIVNKLLLKSDVCQLNQVLYKYRYYYSKKSIKSMQASKGLIFDEYLLVLDRSLGFAKQLGIDIPKEIKSQAYKHYANQSVSNNGVISWTSLRYEGNFFDKNRVIIAIFVKCVKIDHKILAKPNSYPILFLNLLPSILHNRIVRLYLSHFFQMSVKKTK